jgi:hypothetical protein
VPKGFRRPTYVDAHCGFAECNPRPGRAPERPAAGRANRAVRSQQVIQDRTVTAVPIGPCGDGQKADFRRRTGEITANVLPDPEGADIEPIGQYGRLPMFRITSAYASRSPCVSTVLSPNLSRSNSVTNIGSSGDAGINTTYLCVGLEVAAALVGPP